MKRIASTVFLAGLMGLPTLAFSPAVAAAVSVGVGVSDGGFSAGVAISTEPPPLPIYDQPVAPDQGYIWTPGYWAWAPAGYFYWVDGAWVLPPTVGLLWTPGWWGWSDGFFRWHPGYWGPMVGFYGGIDYGYGYFGTGYSGGYWMNNRFYYNTAVSRVNVTVIHNTYVDKTVIRNRDGNRVSYNGGRGGLTTRPTVQQQAFARQRRVEATPAQVNRRDEAMRNPAQRYDTNRSRFSGNKPLSPSAPSGRGGPQSTAPDSRGPQSGAIRAQEPNRESRPNGPQGSSQFQGDRGPNRLDDRGTNRPGDRNANRPGDRGANRPDAQRPAGGQEQPAGPGTSRFERGSAPGAAPASRPQMQQPMAPRIEQTGRPQAPQPSAPRFEQPSRPPVQQPNRPQVQPPMQPRMEQRPSAPQAPRFEPRAAPRPEAPRMESRPAAPRMESRPAAPRMEAPRAAPRAQAPAERRGGGQDRGGNRREE